jgi:predicted CxxxxCH...CXXCH cytochrome family protein
MNKKILAVLITLLLLILVFSCAEKKDTVSVAAHPEGWTVPTSDNFHGKFVSGSNGKLQNCTSCHGEDYQGGTSEVSCFNSDCHAIYPHSEGFANTQSSNFHGNYVAQQLNFNIIPCAACHGQDFMGDGDPAKKNCYMSGCHSIFPHDDNFNEESSSEFHGKFIADSLDWDYSGCQSCHGVDYMGEGYAVKNCVTCHDNIFPHPDGFINVQSDKFHGDYVAETLDFVISDCADCHGTDFKGNGYGQKNCFRCHTIYPHPDGFVPPGSDKFHGNYIADSLGGDLTTCKACHGQDLQGAGYEQKNCQSCHALYPHPDNFASPASANFHGDYIAESLDFDLDACKTCHGDDFKGDGDADKNCYTCHALYPHTGGFANEDSAGFHGDYIENTLNWDITSCQDCHGEDYAGAGYEEKNCRRCHTEYPHAEGIVDTTSANFHGTNLAENYDFDASTCATCHGSDYEGNGYEKKNCYRCHSIYPHIDGFANPGIEDYHGNYIIQDLSFDISSCATCHGNNYSGEGYEQKDCRACHQDYPHPQGFTNTTSDNFHGIYLAETYNWVMDACQVCHGENYNGEGYSEKNCKSCHPGPNGPEACNTCHGSAQNDAPPKDLSGNTETTYIGVGAHQAHVIEGDLSLINEMECSSCHITPTDYKDPGHINDGTPNAEVVFSEFATDSNTVDAHWDHATGTCSNIYCHGAFEFDKASAPAGHQFAYVDSIITGNNPDVVWTDVGSGQAACGTCHGLPPVGHPSDYTGCSNCHSSVVDASNNIIDKSKHINGKVNVFGE